MKVSSILQQYQNGERNFQWFNLRGLNFAGKDLSGADFSGCQIQGTNFKEANLTGANFTGAKAGLQKRWVIYLTLWLCLLAAFPEYFLFQSLKFPILPINNLSKLTNIITASAILIIYGYSFLKYSLNEKVSIIVSAYIFMGAIATGFAFFEIRFVNLETYIILGLSIFAITLIATICTAICWLICEQWIIYILPLLSATCGLIEGYLVSKETEFSMMIGIFISLIGWVIGSITGYLGVQENENHEWVRPISLLITSYLGTNFKNANLTDANFTHATLKNTNFNQAHLTRTCFKNTIKLNLARAGKTILANPNVVLVVETSKAMNLVNFLPKFSIPLT
ncbi:MAG: pentapeptide repeat-containing protein [Microcystaceae cyanobacterium]